MDEVEVEAGAYQGPYLAEPWVIYVEKQEIKDVGRLDERL